MRRSRALSASRAPPGTAAFLSAAHLAAGAAGGTRCRRDVLPGASRAAAGVKTDENPLGSRAIGTEGFTGWSLARVRHVGTYLFLALLFY